MDKMKYSETEIQGVFLIENLLFQDERGKFIKTYQKSIFNEMGLKFDLKESFFSISALGVIRGLHFQFPPFAQEKLVYVPKGRIMDIVLDIRVNSPSYNKYIVVELSEENGYSIYIPTGCAHGFQSLENDTITFYSQGAEYEPSADGGINPLSLGIEWPIKEYILSQKDRNFKHITDFESPFKL
jgi:dTDP-4-dehydrorhamnose 3,5-epimerase